MNSYAEENYLKVIYKLSVIDKRRVITKSIADRIGTKPSSVTDMIRKLSEKKLLNYERYHGVKLTPEGKQIAVSIIRKHRLWEEFLSEYLGFKWDEIHEIAEELEHINSELLIEKLDKFLKYPKFDPHGDPIPDRQGVFPGTDSILLSEIEPGSVCIVNGLVDKSESFLRYLDELGIHIGSEIVILREFKFDLSVEIDVDNKSRHSISRKVSENILIRRKK
jgi:DtxR family transcriptional regulator, Mn-dependent transcriptional regulator